MTRLLTALLAAGATAHFTMVTPPSIGFSDDSEGTAPCGSFTPDLSGNLTQFHVEGDAIAMLSGHPQANWLFRGASFGNGTATQCSKWTQLFPIVQQSGFNTFCEPAITVPAEWAGTKGILSVVASAVDGLLFQCSVVQFVAGKGTPPTTCTNSTGVSGAFVADSALTPLVAEADACPAGASGAPSPTSSSGPAPSQSKSAAPGSPEVAGMAALYKAGIALSMALLGAAYMA